jgi:thiosulfate reductase cytochrome b subunit
MSTQPAAKRSVNRSFVIRITHWVNAIAIVIMITSGWRIYDASPIWPFMFPPFITLGGWLGGALAWHFAAFWMLIGNGLVYVVYGVASGHFRRDFLPLSPRAAWRDFTAALALRLEHHLGSYNAMQKLLYGLVLLMGFGAILSGFAIWKPVQFQALTALMGGYDTARIVHFAMMAGIVGFLVIHLTLVVLVPSTLLPMITGAGHARSRPASKGAPT